MINDKEEIVMSFWAIGPTYRKYLIANIEDKLKNSLGLFKFVILTDYKEDFYELKNKTSLCLDILDINEERKNYEWSFELEKIPNSKTDPEYGFEFLTNLQNNYKWSYSLHRFVFPWFIKNGITKFIYADPDVHLTARKTEYSTIQEYFENNFLSHIDNKNEKFVVGIKPAEVRDPINDYFFNLLNEKLSLNKSYPIDKKYPQLDGCIKYHSFRNVEEVQEFFNVWNEGIRVSLTDANTWPAWGGFTYNDEILLGAVFSLLDVKVYGIKNTVWAPPHTKGPYNFGSLVLKYPTENHWWDPIMGGWERNATSLENFIDINKAHFGENYNRLDFSDIWN